MDVGDAAGETGDAGHLDVAEALVEAGGRTVSSRCSGVLEECPPEEGRLAPGPGPH